MKKLQRFLCLILTVAMLLSMHTVGFAADTGTGYSDVSANAWYAEAVQYVRDAGLMNGTNPSTFSPDATTSRAMLATILYRAAGNPGSSSHSFTDVPAGSWYENAAAWANSYGIMSGYGGGRFGGDDPVTREQIVTIFWRYAGGPAAGSSADFADEANISSYAAQATDWARANNIINGKDGNRFDPQGTTTRAETAMILRNYMTTNPRTPQQSTGSQQPVTPQQPVQEPETPVTTPQQPSNNQPSTPSRPSSTNRPSSSNRPSYDRPARPSTPDPTPDPTPTPDPEPTPTSDILVVYFSATNNTEAVAGYIADALDADQYEIVPAVPYTSDDLDWTDPDSRVNDEHNNPSSRPAIRSHRNLSSYDTIFLGYPIWWGEAPNIIYTFMEENNLDGKMVIPFCTSSSSGIGSSADNLHRYAPSADWQDGQRFRSGASRTEVQQWVFSLNLDENTPEPAPTPDPEPTPTPTPDPDPEPTPTPTPDPDPEPTPTPTPDPDPEPTPAPTSKTLVVYFSASNNTERVAGYIAEALDADQFELIPVKPYTSADLNWTDSSSRVNAEHNDISLRNIPLTSTTVNGWDSYDTVFIGYPIWWGIAAWPTDTFVKANDFTGKTVIPFCTSTSSGLGQSGTLLAEMAGTGDWQTGQRFRSGASQSEVQEWVNSLHLGGNTPEPEPNPEPNPNPDPKPGHKTLVAYFSATNTTERVAQTIADTLDADLFELEPVNPYTSADLNYGNASSRVSREHNDPSLQNIELKQTTPSGWDNYDTVLIGYPIWWHAAAWPVNHFITDNSFEGKKVVPFCTSASSGLEGSDLKLRDMAGSGNWLPGRNFFRSDSDRTISDWVESLGLNTTTEVTSGNTVATAKPTPHDSQRLYLWEEGNVPATTKYTVNNGGYSDDPDFRPYLTSFPVPDGTDIRGAVLICAGGAFQFRSPQEGAPIAEALSAQGFQSFVVDYRLRPYTQEEGALDLARAVRFVRAHADEYGIDEKDIAVMGFSAGGILAGEMLRNYDGTTSPTVLDPTYVPDALDRVSADAAADGMIYSFYGRLSVGDMDVEALRRGNLPPTFYCYGTRDPFYQQFLANANAVEDAGVQVERLSLEGMPHGFGAQGGWIPTYAQWLNGIFNNN